MREVSLPQSNFTPTTCEIWANRIAAIAADCKSAPFEVLWFESTFAHHYLCGPIVQLVERQTVNLYVSGSSPDGAANVPTTPLIHAHHSGTYINNLRKKLFTIKKITMEEMRLLEKHKIIKNTKYGYIDKNGNPTGFYRTRHKAYIEDRFVDMAKDLS